MASALDIAALEGRLARAEQAIRLMAAPARFRGLRSSGEGRAPNDAPFVLNAADERLPGGVLLSSSSPITDLQDDLADVALDVLNLQSDTSDLASDLVTLEGEVNLNRLSAILISPIAMTASLTATRTVLDGRAFALYVGKAPKDITSIDIYWRTTTALVIGASGSWAEVAVATGTPMPAANPTLTVKKYADVLTEFQAAAGIKSKTLSSFSIDAGDDIWLVIGANRGTGGSPTTSVVRAYSMADDLQMGCSAQAVTQPSANVGSGVAYTVDTAAALPVWAAAKI